VIERAGALSSIRSTASNAAKTTTNLRNIHANIATIAMASTVKADHTAPVNDK
jgi:hypothetical protein